jgi:phage FluMu gp28-like protein
VSTEAPSLVTTFLIEYLDLPEATGLPDASWETFQIRHLNNPKLLGITDKSRQVGWSWLAAAESVGISCIQRRNTSIFVSINQDEAQEKIRYAKAVIEALDKEVRPKLITDNAYELEFQNGSRLISHPCRPVRGKARARVYLDEFAHYARDREIYQSAVPVISKGGVLRIGSSPLGAGGMFWEIFAESMQRYPGYVRDVIPWWQVRALCRDVRKASLLAPGMTTADRVYRFGTERIITIYENMPLEDFQQEYECEWVDESVAWIDWELIKRNQLESQDGKLEYLRAKTPDAALAAIDELAGLIRAGKVEPVLVGGMDIGRRHDTSEITLLGKSTTGQTPYRLGITLDRCEFDTQALVVDTIMERLPVSQFMIDQNGIGMQLVETAVRKWGARVQPAEFTNPNKELWAVEVKLRFQRAEIPIPTDRDFTYQVHSVKKKVTESKNAVFDCDASEKHHADQFWALALAVWASKPQSAAEDWIGKNKSILEEQENERSKRIEVGRVRRR